MHMLTQRMEKATHVFGAVPSGHPQVHEFLWVWRVGCTGGSQEGHAWQGAHTHCQRGCGGGAACMRAQGGQGVERGMNRARGVEVRGAWAGGRWKGQDEGGSTPATRHSL